MACTAFQPLKRRQIRVLEIKPGPRNAKDPNRKDVVQAVLLVCSLGEYTRDYTSDLAKSTRVYRWYDERVPWEHDFFSPWRHSESEPRRILHPPNMKFSALSYSWGEQTEMVDLMLNGGMRLLISRHLDNGLRQLRHPRKPVTVWIDAICINQEDVAERNSQVGLMGQIFASATYVYIWLGLARGTLPVKERLRFRDGRIVNGTRWQHGTNPSTDEELLVGLPASAAQDLIRQGDRAWWRRKWVLQEIALNQASNERVLFDDYVFNGGAFLAQWDKSTTASTKHGGPQMPWNLKADLASYEAAKRISSGTPDPARLGYLLHLTALSVCSEPRDHIFSIIGLAKEDHQTAIGISYGSRLGDIYRHVSKFCWEDAKHNAAHLPGYRPLPSSIRGDLPSSLIDSLCCRWHRYDSPSWASQFNKPCLLNYDQLVCRWQYLSEWPDWPEMKAFDLGETGHVVSLHPLLNTSIDSTNADILLLAVNLGTVKAAIRPQDVREGNHVWTAMASELGCAEDALRSIASELLNPETAPRPDYWRSRRETVSYGWHMFDLFATDTGHVGLCYNRRFRQSGEAGDVGVNVGDHVVHLAVSTMSLLVRPTQAGDVHLLDPCLLSNDGCGCKTGRRHEIKEFDRVTLV